MVVHRLALFISVGLLCSGCSSPIHREDIVGRYSRNRGHARDELVVRNDGSYLHVYEQPNQPVITDSGRWSMDTIDGILHITFDNFVPRYWNEIQPGMAQPRGYWPVEVER